MTLPNAVAQGSISCMHPLRASASCLALVLVFGPLATARVNAAALGLFEGQSDIGGPRRAGSARFDESSRGYAVSGGGANMWFTNDAFHYVWTKVSGDVS